MSMKAAELVEKFRYALDNRWGYIYGTAGILWTAARQKQKIDYMVNKYGTSWKKNSEAREDNYYSAALNGEKWIGSYVADCSGLFHWAYNKLGEYIAHGSNSIWDGYCSTKGSLFSGKRRDGKELMPGTAVFTLNIKDGKHNHIGLYVGSGKVIEASGTIAGVCTSNITDGKWKCFGELKKVEYDSSAEPGGDPVERLTIRKGSKGDAVAECQKMLLTLGYDLGPYGVDGDFGKATEAAVKAFQKDHDLTVDGIVGRKTWEALESAFNSDEPPKEPKYVVTIPGLDLSQAKAVCNNYPGSTYKEMS